jgi:hypothetical protein
MDEQSELIAADAKNAELAEGYGPYSVEECKMRYGSAFDALARIVHEQAGR